jgi:hypothetical protein
MGRVAAAIVGCALVGVGLAALTRPASLLAGAQSGPPTLESVWAQLYHAKQVDTEAAWKAVINKFPDAGLYYHNLAKQGLAYYYIRTHEFDKAIEPLKDLAAQDDFKPFGLAGLVVVYTAMGDDKSAYDANEQLTTDMKAPLAKQTPQMAELLNKARDTLAWRASGQFL